MKHQICKKKKILNWHWILEHEGDSPPRPQTGDDPRRHAHQPTPWCVRAFVCLCVYVNVCWCAFLGTCEVMADRPSRLGPSGAYGGGPNRQERVTGTTVSPVLHAPARLNTHTAAISNRFMLWKSSNRSMMGCPTPLSLCLEDGVLQSRVGMSLEPKLSALVHGVCLRKKCVSVACLKSATEGRLCCEVGSTRIFTSHFFCFFFFPRFVGVFFTGNSAVQSKCNRYRFLFILKKIGHKTTLQWQMHSQWGPLPSAGTWHHLHPYSGKTRIPDTVQGPPWLSTLSP